MNVKKIIIYAMFTVIILLTSGCSNDNTENTKNDNNLRKIYIEKMGKKIEEIDVSKAKKIDKIYVKKYQNVKKGDKQQIKIIRR